MGKEGEAMDTTRVLKLAFAASAVLYGAVAVAVLGPPDWGRPLLPHAASGRMLYLVFLPLTVGVWAAGSAFGRLARPPASLGQARGAAPWPRLRLIMGCAFLESGAIFGLVLSFVSGDPRPALATAVVTAVLILMLPSGETASSPA
jgi:hypothetical protein